MSAPFTIAREGSLARDGDWRLVRRTLGVRAFGINLVEVPPGGALPAHDERGPDQEEVYVVLDGRPVVRIDGDEHAVEPGTFIRFDPAVERAVHNPGAAPARLLMVSAPVDSGFVAMDWA